jgi:hypothetical protein
MNKIVLKIKMKDMGYITIIQLINNDELIGKT